MKQQLLRVATWMRSVIFAPNDPRNAELRYSNWVSTSPTGRRLQKRNVVAATKPALLAGRGGSEVEWAMSRRSSVEAAVSAANSASARVSSAIGRIDLLAPAHVGLSA
jgi:hypothetical protein